jgi:uncharacterized DUF497 family protein
VLPVTSDPAKNAANRAKHGMDLADAGDFDFNTAIVEEDRDVRHEWRLQATDGAAAVCGSSFSSLMRRATASTPSAFAL